MVEPAADEAPPPSSPRRRRSPLIDVAVALFGGYMLVTMFGDVRYFLRGGTPTDLGDAAALIKSGAIDDAREQYVTIRGTPDVQHAARARIGEKTVGYLRIVEGGGSLFAAIPRTDKPTGNQFEGEFTGRMRRVADVRMFAWITQYFDGERIVETRDITSDQLLAAIDGNQFQASDQITLGVDQPDARIQLGRTSFTSHAAAQAAVAALGVPFIAPDDQKSNAFYTFIARIPADQRAAAQATLTAAGQPATPEQLAKPDPRIGALVVPFFTTYLVPAAEIKHEGTTLNFPLGDDATSPGHIVVDGKLVPRALEAGRLTIETSQLRAVGRLAPIRVDPNGYIIQVGEHPRDQWPTLTLWLVVLAVVGWNLTSLARWWRLRQA